MFTSDPFSALSVAHRRGSELHRVAANERLLATPSPRRRLAAWVRGTADLLARPPLAGTPARHT